eukprot:2861589-Pyramimonas_sp.AAC.1
MAQHVADDVAASGSCVASLFSHVGATRLSPVTTGCWCFSLRARPGSARASRALTFWPAPSPSRQEAHARILGSCHCQKEAPCCPEL